MKYTKCSKCGRIVIEGTKICPDCGITLFEEHDETNTEQNETRLICQKNKSFFEAIIICFSKYASFNGRARRSEYWYFFLFNALISITIGIIVIYGSINLFGKGIIESFKAFRAINITYNIIVLLPLLAVSSRRLHDIDKSSLNLFWYLFTFPTVLPITGFYANTLKFISSVACIIIYIIFLVWFCKEGTIGDNKYGKDPKYYKYTD